MVLTTNEVYDLLRKSGLRKISLESSISGWEINSHAKKFNKIKPDWDKDTKVNFGVSPGSNVTVYSYGWKRGTSSSAGLNIMSTTFKIPSNGATVGFVLRKLLAFHKKLGRDSIGISDLDVLKKGHYFMDYDT